VQEPLSISVRHPSDFTDKDETSLRRWNGSTGKKGSNLSARYGKRKCKEADCWVACFYAVASGNRPLNSYLLVTFNYRTQIGFSVTGVTLFNKDITSVDFGRQFSPPVQK